MTREEPSRQLQKKTTMHVGKQINCAFCLGGHKHEDCRKVKDVNELIKFGRCFSCFRKGHLSRDCKVTVSCKFCKGKHHSCLCCTDCPKEGGASENKRDPSNEESVGNNVHIRMGYRVVLKTAQAQVAGKGNVQRRLLFNTASHMSFIRSPVATNI